MSRIFGLPDSFSDENTMILVGAREDGTLRVLNVDALERLDTRLQAIEEAIHKGSVIRDVFSYEVAGSAIEILLAEGVGRKLVTAEYRNNGPELLNLRLINHLGIPTSGEMLMQPGRSDRVERHRGFVARTPNSAPTILEVTVYE